ncbi:Iron-sulfur cluster insertion protein ErpA [Buchnera aphidicola (Eriosoma lanigerum)]
MEKLNIPINISPAAAKRTKYLILNQSKKDMHLRIYITGGGCAGFQYQFMFDDKIKEDDLIIKQLGIKIIIDSITLQYLIGGKIDYEENLEGSKFIITNPNAKNTCSCGLSFNI